MGDRLEALAALLAFVAARESASFAAEAWSIMACAERAIEDVLRTNSALFTSAAGGRTDPKSLRLNRDGKPPLV